MVRRVLSHRHTSVSLADASSRHTSALEEMTSAQVPEGQKAAAKVLAQTIQRQIIDRIDARASLEEMIDEILRILEGRQDLLESIWPSLERISSSNRIREDWVTIARSQDEQ